MNIREIRYINLRRNIIKRMLMEFILIKSGYPKKRVPGVAWSKEENKYGHLVKRGLEDYVKEEETYRQNGVLGCWAAHTNAINDTKDHHGIIVVLEDDFVFKNDFFGYALSMINRFDRHFDLIVFDPLGLGPKRDHFIKPGIFDPKGHSYPYYFGSHCLFINASSVSKILKATKRSKVRDYDGFVLYSDEIQSYVFYTGKSTPVSLGSNITGRKGPLVLLNGLQKWLHFRMTK